tara:strand:- start:549 stop:770 length:222 start_codon:yes stop_codon:yes gene_type:complete
MAEPKQWWVVWRDGEGKWHTKSQRAFGMLTAEATELTDIVWSLNIPEYKDNAWLIRAATRSRAITMARVITMG